MSDDSIWQFEQAVVPQSRQTIDQLLQALLESLEAVPPKTLENPSRQFCIHGTDLSLAFVLELGQARVRPQLLEDV